MPDSPPTQRVTRLAPSPTGALHLGNARTFVANWVLARQRGWRILMRIEDLDGPRLKPGADQMAIDDLAWLGLDWDNDPSYQRHNLSLYHEALAALDRQQLTYACTCTRREIEAAQSAPHGDQHELRYPGTCRDRPAGAAVASPAGSTALRLRVPDESVAFTDAFAGPQSFNPQQTVGDFVVATKQSLPAYQLAVVVDDHRQGVTDVVRGDDLLRSTARQLLLYRTLAYAPQPTHWHLPLVLGRDGRRLAKRHGDTRLAHYREHGVPPERVLGLLAHWCGILDHPAPLSLHEFQDGFRLDNLSRQPVTMTAEDDAWLLDTP